ncbi:MAG: aminopeptidase P N-terminal domain-containing protein [Candidatus Binataceae bacterium]
MSANGKMEMFQRRRRRFMDAVGACSAAILPSAPVSVRSNDVEYLYRQDSDFYYLTAFPEPESVALFAPGNPDGEFVLFVRPRDKERETWTGTRAGIEGAIVDYGADKAFTIDELDRVVSRYLERAERVHYGFGLGDRMNTRILALIRTAQEMRPRVGSGPTAILNPREIVHEARLTKEPEEIELMRRAITISAEAHKRAMAKARGGMFEWQVEAEVDYTFRSLGASGPSYPSIVASGPNAAILHHVQNDRELHDGELLLIDAGCEYQYYASDVTRTFPVHARFSQLQRELYSIVLDAQLKAIETVKPGVHFDEPHDAALRVLVAGMISVGLLKGSVDDAIAQGSYRRFYMHRTSHWLGMDVHDVGLYRRGDKSRVLEPGMVLTVEPGIYVNANEDAAPDQFRGIGIRIEDDVLVTESGHEVLTAAIPKRIDEVESLTCDS